jgi:hypothetical protein
MKGTVGADLAGHLNPAPAKIRRLYCNRKNAVLTIESLWTNGQERNMVVLMNNDGLQTEPSTIC